MNAKMVKNWLKSIDDDAEVKVYIETEDKDLISPNMGYALMDEDFRRCTADICVNDIISEKEFLLWLSNS